MTPAEQPDDEALMRAFIRGDGTAMETLFRRHRQPVYTWLLRTTSSRADADELHQDVWLRVIRRSAGYRSGNFKAWLWRIVRNAAIDRARKLTPELTLDLPAADDDSHDESRLDLIRDETAVDALSRLDEAERRAAVRAAVEHLPSHQKEVILLRIGGELTFRDIAAVTGAPLGTVLARMHQGMKRLKEIVCRERRLS
jgi:RNA polymerase sigma-70 factor (ECF subfamily)